MPTSHPVTIQRDRLLERFLRYVQVETSAAPGSTSVPSSPGQLELGRRLADELRKLSLSDVTHSDQGVVCATIPATTAGDLPTVALVAHVDTSPEAPGANVRPQVIDSYDGEDITLPSGAVISTRSYPDLLSMQGQTLVTTDGTTLLGGDDKAGVAIIMELAQTLIEQPSIPHGPIKIVFTCDEEIGHGTDHIDVSALEATVAYTVDGGGQGVIDHETFSADAATVTFTGHNIHPAIAKGRMLNSIRAASDFVASLPRDRQTPETTDDREGFLHVHDITGGVGQTEVELILRSFETSDLPAYADQLRELADAAAESWPGMRADVAVRRQYRNLRDGLAELPEAIDFAEEAFARLGVPCRREIIRGGTDGSQLTEKGLPTPNLSSGQHNIHSVLEFANLDEMLVATSHLIELVQLWAAKGKS